MKKVTLLLSVVATLFVASCFSSKNTTSSVSLTGEWNIVAVDGNAVDTSKVQQAPYIGFDRVENRIYGSASCNRFFAELKLDSIKSEISFGAAGATRMMCPQMETEDAILAALSKITRYKVLSNGEVNMYDANGQSMLLIRKK